VNIYWIICSLDWFKLKVKAEFNADLTDLDALDGRFQVFEKENQKVGVIWASTVSELAHEIFHCVVWMLNSRGLWLTESSEEAYAYLIDFLDRKIRRGIS
jgi:hypothetical protein